MEHLTPYLPVFWEGLRTTVLITLLSTLGAAGVSVVLGSLRVVTNRPLRTSSRVTIEFFRGATVVIYLFWVYYAFPSIPGMPRLTPLLAAVLVLSICGGAYGAEIVRAGLQAIPKAHHDATRALGLSRSAAFRKVVLPQALSQIVPSFANVAVGIMKDTTIVMYIGIQDVFYVANSARAVTDETMLIYLLLILIYWTMSIALGAGFRRLELALPLNRAMKTVELRKKASPRPPIATMEAD